jgi:hypothetical protein
MNPGIEDSALIDKLGGSGAVARLCGVTSQAVSVWRRKGIPDLRRRLLMLEHADLVKQASVAPGARQQTAEGQCS